MHSTVDYHWSTSVDELIHKNIRFTSKNNRTFRSERKIVSENYPKASGCY